LRHARTEIRPFGVSSPTRQTRGNLRDTLWAL